MDELVIKLTKMAHGGTAMGRDKNGRSIFVPFALPGERVRVRLLDEKSNYSRAELIEILTPSSKRIEPRCPHFGICGGCHFQHMDYETQLATKRTITHDQLQRIGGFRRTSVQPTLPNPQPWAYRMDVTLSPVGDGKLGFWSPTRRQVIPIDICHIIHPRLLELWQDIDLDLPELRKLTLRIGSDEELLIALEVEGVEPPSLEADFPVSVAIVLPDGTAASLVGDTYIVRTVKDRDFRVSPGCYFQPSVAGVDVLVDTVLELTALSGRERVLELYTGVGMLTAFLAEQAAEVTGIEVNSDAVQDLATNLEETDNVALYEGLVEDVLPLLTLQPDVAVVNPPAGGMSEEALRALVACRPVRLVYVSADVATLARDGRFLSQAGYRPTHIQPIDLAPQTYQIDVVSLWETG
ncbi:MAG: class I SAM-dependent RNA methyltransferase [Chloroflexi bacterium]|nr:MAG: class I SAM-dependent RNA methyltransferase [Chloroflexota bacterium]